MEAKEVILLLETAKYFICLADTVMKSNIRLSQEAVNVLNDYFVKQFVFMNYLQSMNYSFGAKYNNATNFPCASLNDNSQQMFKEKDLNSAVNKPASAPGQTSSSHRATSSSKTVESLVKGSKAFIGTSPKHEQANQFIDLSKSITGFYTSYIDSVVAKKIQSFKVYCHICDKLLDKNREWSQHVFNECHRDTVKLSVSHGKRMQMFECPSCVVSIYGDIDDSQGLIDYHYFFIHPSEAEKSDKGLDSSSNIIHSVSSESLCSKNSSNTPLYSNRDINYSTTSASISSLPNKVNKINKFFKSCIDKNYCSGMKSVFKCTFCEPCMVWCQCDKDWNTHSNGKSHKKITKDVMYQKDMFFSCNGCGLSIYGLSSSLAKLIEYHNVKVHPLKSEKSSTSSVEASLRKSQDSDNIKSKNIANYFDSILRYLKKTKMTFYCALCDKYLDKERLKVHITGIQHNNCVKSNLESNSLRMFTCNICPELTVFGEENFVLQLFKQHLYYHKQTYLEQNKEFTYNDIKKEIDWTTMMPGFKLSSVKNTSKVNSKITSPGNTHNSKVGHLPSSMHTSTPTSSDIQKKQKDNQLSKGEVISDAASLSKKGTNSVFSECLEYNKDNKDGTSSNTGSKKGSSGKSGKLVKSDTAVTKITCLPNTSSGYADNDDCITNLFSGYIDALSAKLITDVGVYCHQCDIVLNKDEAASQHFSSRKHINCLKLSGNPNAIYKHCDICQLSMFGVSEVLTKLYEYHLIRNHNNDNNISVVSSVDKESPVCNESQNRISENPLNSNSTSNDNHTTMESNSHVIRSEQSSYSEFENLVAGMAEEFALGVNADGGYCTVCSMAFLMDAFGWEFHMMEHRNNPSNISQCTLQTCKKCSLKIFGTDHDTFLNLPSHKALH